MDLAACDGVGQSQDGLITRRQAKLVLSENQIDYLLREKTWNQLYPTVYRMTGVPDTWHRRVRGATLGRTNMLASHLTAAHLWGLVDWQSPEIEMLTLWTNSARLPGVTVRRTRNWHDCMQAVAGGIGTTRPARTLIDISGKCSNDTLKRALDAGITKRLLTFDDLYTEFDRIGTRGRSRCSPLLAVLSRYDKRYEKTDSGGEIDILDWINGARLASPTPQLRIPIGKDDTVRPDYAYPQHKIAIEVQSWRWHGGPVQQERDAQKAIALAALGWITLPVLPRQENRVAFVHALTRLLQSRSAA